MSAEQSDDPRTPSGVTILAQLPDGSTVNVTEGVQTLYDHVISSMDWGSGFLTKEDAIPIAEIARVCGFESSEEAERYIHSMEEEERRRAAAKIKVEEAAREREELLARDPCRVLGHDLPLARGENGTAPCRRCGALITVTYGGPITFKFGAL